MKRPAKVSASSPAGSRAILYTLGKSKTIELILPVATPEELRRSIRLSRTSRRRVDRAVAKARSRRKTA